MPIVLKYGSLNLQELSEPVQVCNGIALPFTADSESARLGFEPLLGLIRDTILVVFVNIWGGFCVERACLLCFSIHSSAVVHKFTCLHLGLLYVQLHGYSKPYTRIYIVVS